jgi:hypothetical protein
MAYHFAVAAFGVAGLFGVWLGVQALVRKNSKGLAPEEDVLACRTCGAEGACAGCAGAPRDGGGERGAKKN